MATKVDRGREARPKRRRGGIVALVAAVAVLGLAAAAYFLFLDADSPDRLALSEDPTPATSAPAAAAAATAASGLEGRWVVQPGSSTVGYRVRETFAGVAAPVDAVGRTTAVEGEATISGSTLETARVTADMTQLESDEDRRDNFLRGRAIETDRFTRATFTLTEPVDLGTEVQQGATVDVTARGDLELHGVTKPVEIPLQGRWDGDTVEVVGSVPIAFADYGIETPNVAGFVSVEDDGELELQLVMSKG